MLYVIWAAAAGLAVGLALLMIALGKIRNGWPEDSKRDSVLFLLYIAIALLVISLVLVMVHSCMAKREKDSDPPPAGGPQVVTLKAGQSVTLAAM